MPVITLGRCLNDPNLFAHHFRARAGRGGRCFWRRCLPSLRIRRRSAVYRERTGRTAWPTAPFTEAAVIVGRRGGKSRTLALIAVYLACFRDYDQYLAPGEVATIGVLAVDKGQARTIFRFVLGLLKAVPMLEPLIVRRDSETIELSNRVHIEIATASFRSRRAATAMRRCWRRGRVLAFGRDVAESRCRNFARVAAGAGEHPGRHVADGVEPLRASGASFTTPFAGTSARTTRASWCGKPRRRR